MTREQIEKAWEEHTLCNPSMMDDISLNEKQAFVKGAQWRINSAWHDASEEPKIEDSPLLVEYQIFGFEGSDYTVCENIWEYHTRLKREGSGCDVLRWSCISNLLPERKEETNGGR